VHPSPNPPAGKPTTFDGLVTVATEVHRPYPYQRRLAEDGLPDLLRVPTGAGKTLAAVLPWLFRRRYHPDWAVRDGTPRRLVLVLPQRALVEQTVAVVGEWLGRLGETSSDDRVGLHVLMGGASTDDRAWKMRPAADAILVGTQDMVLSRLLLRGYGEPRAAWPVAFGLLHSSTQFVFDEVQLMGPALPTSLQLEALRSTIGTAAPCRSMWMSATVDPAMLRTVDFAGPDRAVELAGDDRVGPLRHRLDATRRIERGDVTDDRNSYPSAVAQLALHRHAPGTRTIVLLNTVERATAVFDAMVKSAPAARIVLLHSRFRPADRAAHAEEALATPAEHGTVVVTTQVLEAGVDVSSRLLVTEVAPWSSVVQRAGRCNRGGEHADAVLVWLRVPTGKNSAAPYIDEDLRKTAEALTALEGEPVTSSDLQEAQVAEETPLHPVLRRRDVLDLLDTAPDLSGNDIDVGRWIRDAEENTVSVAWRPFTGDVPDDAEAAPARDELCSVPLGALRERVRQKSGSAVVHDQVTGEWRTASPEDARPGGIVVLDATKGGYTPERGWSPTSAAPVDAIARPAEDTEDQPAGIGGDPLTGGQGRWVPLAEHLADVEQEVHRLVDELGDLPGLSAPQRRAATVAGLYHDLGKAHPTFVASLNNAARDHPAPLSGGPWAKSPSKAPLRHYPRFFRHELVSALVVRHPDSMLLEGIEEPDLVTYLVAAHHGKARMSVRALPDEQGSGRVLGLEPDSELPEITLPDGRVVPAVRLDLHGLALGAGADGQDSWQAMTCRLRDRPDVGPFRLGFLEALVRVADWRASARYDTGGEGTKALQ